MAGSPERSVERVLDLLEELAFWPYGVSLSEISVAVNLNRTTVYRLLTALVNKGFVLKDPDSGKYRLSMKLFELGSPRLQWPTYTECCASLFGTIGPQNKSDHLSCHTRRRRCRVPI